MLATWLKDELESVPPFNAFLGSDGLDRGLFEIAGKYPDLACLRRIGTSRQGEPLHCLTVGEGSTQAVVFGLPHPNEPIGGLTALHLARRLCEDAALRRNLDLRWHIVACIDPDGLRLNQGWLDGPFTREHYARHFYRPAGEEQIEWTFPFAHKGARFDAVLPETQALMNLIDRTKPALMCSLHNSELGGVYYYLSRPQPALHPVLQAIPAHLGLPLHRGEPEAPWLSRFDEGIFEMLSLEAAYDHYERVGEDVSQLSGGTTSDAYARRYGTLTLLPELPYWSDPRMGDGTVTTTQYADALRQHAEGMSELTRRLRATLDAVADHVAQSPFLRASQFFVPALEQVPGTTSRRAEEAASQRPATVAELASLEDTVHSYRLRYGGMLLRAMSADRGIKNPTDAVHAHQVDLKREYDNWCTQAAAAGTAAPIPIQTLVATQYAAVLATARHLADK